MKVLMDILTPKQVLLFSKLSENLTKRGHEVLKTTRRYREVTQLLKLKGVDAAAIGEHGGRALVDKLKSSAKRTLEIAALFEEFKPDLSISFSSPEMARASFGLNVPHICVNDSPHAEAVARLTVPISERLLTPRMIPKSAWTRYGINAEKIARYNALDPWVWLKDFKPDRRILKELGLVESKPTVTFRTEESFAAYLLDKTRKESLISPIITGLLSKRRDLQIVAVPRYEEQVSTLQEVFGDEVIVSKSVVEGSNLLHYTSVFVGAGGTMSAEAVLLGVPTISCYPGESFIIERYLIRRGLITRENDPERITKRIIRLLDNIDRVKKEYKSKVQAMTKGFEDPIEIITEEVEKLA